MEKKKKKKKMAIVSIRRNDNMWVLMFWNNAGFVLLQWKKKMKEEGIFVLFYLTGTTKGILVISRASESISSATSFN